MKTDWSDVREESVNDKYISGEDFNLQRKRKGGKRVKTNQFFINGVREREKVSKVAIISEHLINFHLVHNYRCEKNRLEIETR